MDVVGHDGYKQCIWGTKDRVNSLCLGKNWWYSKVEIVVGCLSVLLQVRGCDGSLRLGDEDVLTGRCYGGVCAVRWGGCLQDMRRGGWGKWLGQQRGSAQYS